MYGPERIWSLLDVKADRIDDRERISNSKVDRFLVVNVSPRCFQSAGGVVDFPLASFRVPCGYSRCEIPIKQAINDVAPDETGSSEDRDRSTFAQRVHQQSLTDTKPLRGSHKLALKAADIAD
jgi:hypothetical protein